MLTKMAIITINILIMIEVTIKFIAIDVVVINDVANDYYEEKT
jgi:hypothetical protein